MAPPKNYDMTVYPIQAAVRSEHDGARAYTVTLPHCPCADFTNRRGQLIPVEGNERIVAVTVCKHIAEALARIGGWSRPEPEPEVRPDLTCPQARELLTAVGLRFRDITALLDRIQVHHGKDSFRSAGAGLPDGEVTYDQPSGLYTVTLQY